MNHPRSIGNAWPVRLWFGVGLLFACEILLWRNPTTHDPLEWAWLIVGYVAMATALLDLIARYRVRDAYGLMLAVVPTVAGIAAILTPQDALIDFPEHLLSRMIGGYGLLTMEIIGLFFFLSLGRRKKSLRLGVGFAFVVGFFAGLWINDAHTLYAWTRNEASFPVVLALIGGFMALLGGLWAVVVRHPVESAAEFKLSERGLALMALLLAFMLFAQIARGVIGAEDLASALALAYFAGLVLWFERGDKGRALIEHATPVQFPGWGWVLALIVSFWISFALGWIVPAFQFDIVRPITVVEMAFLGIGFLWLPFTTTVSASRTIDRQSRKIETPL